MLRQQRNVLEWWEMVNPKSPVAIYYLLVKPHQRLQVAQNVKKKEKDKWKKDMAYVLFVNTNYVLAKNWPLHYVVLLEPVDTGLHHAVEVFITNVLINLSKSVKKDTKSMVQELWNVLIVTRF